MDNRWLLIALSLGALELNSMTVPKEKQFILDADQASENFFMSYLDAGGNKDATLDFEFGGLGKKPLTALQALASGTWNDKDVATRQRAERIARELITSGVDINKATQKELKPLMLALSKRRTWLVLQLLNNGADVSYISSFDVPQDLRGREDILDLIHQKRIQELEGPLNPVSDDFITPLLKFDEVAFNKAFVTLYSNRLLNYRIGKKQVALTPLQVLAYIDRPLSGVNHAAALAMAKTLLEAGADPNRAEPDNTFRPLCLALQRFNPDLAALLLDYGASVKNWNPSMCLPEVERGTKEYDGLNNLVLDYASGKRTPTKSKTVVPPPARDPLEILREDLADAAEALRRLLFVL